MTELFNQPPAAVGEPQKFFDSKILVVDVETTGLDFNKDQVVELGACSVDLKAKKILGSWNTVVYSIVPIPPEASAIHHLTDEMCENGPNLDTAWEQMLKMLGDCDLVIGHNYIKFDKQFLPAHGKPELDTMRLAQKIWPDLEKYTNQYLRYYFKLKPPGITRSAHDAGGDTIVTATTLIRMVDEILPLYGPDVTVQQLIDWCNTPQLKTFCTFPKHRGMEWKMVPKSYIKWCLANMQDLDMDLKYTMQHYS